MIVFRAPATSANIGAGFDTAAVAFDLWNELEVTDGAGVSVEGEGAAELPADESQPRRARLRAPRRPGRQALPLRRTGSRSSAGSARRPPRSRSASSPRRRTRARRSCSPSGSRSSRTPTTSPRRSSAGSRSRGTGGSPGSPSGCRSTPSPSSRSERTSTESSRETLPATVPHAEAAASAGRAALLGAGAASGDAALFSAALERLAPRAVPALGDARRDPHDPARRVRRGDAVGLGPDGDRLGRRTLRPARPSSGPASPTTRFSSSTSHRGAPCERRARRRAAEAGTTTRGTFPARSISTPRPTSRRSGPTRPTAAAIRCPTLDQLERRLRTRRDRADATSCSRSTTARAGPRAAGGCCATSATTRPARSTCAATSARSRRRPSSPPRRRSRRDRATDDTIAAEEILARLDDPSLAAPRRPQPRPLARRGGAARPGRRPDPRRRQRPLHRAAPRRGDGRRRARRLLRLGRDGLRRGPEARARRPRRRPPLPWLVQRVVPP